MSAYLNNSYARLIAGPLKLLILRRRLAIKVMLLAGALAALVTLAIRSSQAPTTEGGTSPNSWIAHAVSLTKEAHFGALSLHEQARKILDDPRVESGLKDLMGGDYQDLSKWKHRNQFVLYPKIGGEDELCCVMEAFYSAKDKLPMYDGSCAVSFDSKTSKCVVLLYRPECMVVYGATSKNDLPPGLHAQCKKFVARLKDPDFIVTDKPEHLDGDDLVYQFVPYHNKEASAQAEATTIEKVRSWLPGPPKSSERSPDSSWITHAASLTMSSRFQAMSNKQKAEKILHDPQVESGLKAVLADDYKDFVGVRDNMYLVDKEQVRRQIDMIRPNAPAEVADELVCDSFYGYPGAILSLNPKTNKCVVVLIYYAPGASGPGYHPIWYHKRVYGAENEDGVPDSLLYSLESNSKVCYKSANRSRSPSWIERAVYIAFDSGNEILTSREIAHKIVTDPQVEAGLKGVMGNNYPEFLQARGYLQIQDETGLDHDAVWLRTSKEMHGQCIVSLNPTRDKCVVLFMSSDGTDCRVYGAQTKVEIPRALVHWAYSSGTERVHYKIASDERLATALANTKAMLSEKALSLLPPNLRDLRAERDPDEILRDSRVKELLQKAMGADYSKFVASSTWAFPRPKTLPSGGLLESIQNSATITDKTEEKARYNGLSVKGDELSLYTYKGFSTSDTIALNLKTARCVVLVAVPTPLPPRLAEFGETVYPEQFIVRIYGAQKGEALPNAIANELGWYESLERDTGYYKVLVKYERPSEPIEEVKRQRQENDPFSFLYGTWTICSVDDGKQHDTNLKKQVKSQIGKRIYLSSQKVTSDPGALAGYVCPLGSNSRWEIDKPRYHYDDFYGLDRGYYVPRHLSVTIGKATMEIITQDNRLACQIADCIVCLKKI